VKSPRERQQNQVFSKNGPVGVQQLSNKHLRTGMDFDEQKICAFALALDPWRLRKLRKEPFAAEDAKAMRV
jgi:hypothetical protein